MIITASTATNILNMLVLMIQRCSVANMRRVSSWEMWAGQIGLECLWTRSNLWKWSFSNHNDDWFWVFVWWDDKERIDWSCSLHVWLIQIACLAYQRKSVETTVMERNINSLFTFWCVFVVWIGEEWGGKKERKRRKRRKGHRACRLWRLTLPRVPVSVVCLSISNNDSVLLRDVEKINRVRERGKERRIFRRHPPVFIKHPFGWWIWFWNWFVLFADKA